MAGHFANTKGGVPPVPVDSPTTQLQQFDKGEKCYGSIQTNLTFQFRRKS